MIFIDFRRNWIKETDSKYVQLAKAGGRPDLLRCVHRQVLYELVKSKRNYNFYWLISGAPLRPKEGGSNLTPPPSGKLHQNFGNP